MSTILELNNIKKAYDVKMAVDIDKLVIEEGDCVGLVGESGCGKSTLAGIITNTVKLYSGYQGGSWWILHRTSYL